MILFAFVIYGMYIGLKNIIRYNKYNIDYDRIRLEHLASLDRYQELTQQMIALDTAEFWEKQAKIELGYIKKNERLIKIMGR